MGQIQYTISLVMIGLFSIALIGFATDFAEDNNTAVDLADDPELSSLDVNAQGNLTSFRGKSEDTYESIVQSSIEEGETTPSGGQFAITPLTAVGTVKNILKLGYIKIFGSGSGFGIFMTSFLALITFVFGMYIWKTWAGRNPD